MRKLINYFYNKLLDKKIKITLLLLVVYHFFIFVQVLKKQVQFNLYDLIIYQFNYTSLFFMLSIAFLIIIYNINNNSKFNEYLMVKFDSKKQYFNINVLTIAIISFLYIFMFNILSIIEGIGKTSIKNIWSQFFLNTNTGTINIRFDANNINLFLDFITPLEYTMILNLLVFLYFFTLGLLFLMINSLLNKRQVTLIILIIFIGLNMSLDSIKLISNFTFTNNIYILTSNNFIFSNYSYLYIRIAYWIFLISISYIIGLIATLKKDYKYGD